MPPVPPGVPTSPDGIPFDPDAELPEVMPEAGTPVTDPSQVSVGSGSADARGEPGSESGSANRPGGVEGGSPEGTAGETGVGGEGEGGTNPEGTADGRPGGLGHEPPEWAPWLTEAATIAYDVGVVVLDVTQVALDVIGLIPGLGEIADGLNGLISLARGDYVGAALSFAAMIPFAGWAATAGRWGRRVVRGADAVSDVTRAVTRYGDEVAEGVAYAARNAGAESVARGVNDFTQDQVRAAMRNVTAHTQTSREVFEGVLSGRIPMDLDSALGVYGRADGARILINSSQSMDDVLAAVVHEGRHHLDIASGVLPERALASATDVIFGETRAWHAALEFAEGAGLNPNALSSLRGLGRMDVRDLIIQVENSYRRDIGRALTDTEMLSVLNRVISSL